MQFVKRSLLPLMALVAFSTPAFALSPPWFLLQAKLKATVGADRCVKVEDLKGESPNFELDIHVCRDKKAEALATLVARSYDFGGVHVQVNVIDPLGNIEKPGPFPPNPIDAAALFKAALRGNNYFVKIDGPKFAASFFLEFRPRVVQYFSDDIGDFYQNTNQTAADAFRDALGLEELGGGKIGVTTSPKKHHLEIED